MSQPRLLPVERPDVSPLTISERLRGQLVYFMTPPGSAGVPRSGRERILAGPRRGRSMARRGGLLPGFPLDSANATEVELTEEQEALLIWLNKHGIQHLRLVE